MNPIDVAWRLLKEDSLDPEERTPVDDEKIQYKFPSAGPYWTLNDRQKKVADAALDLPSEYLSEEGWSGYDFNHLFAEGHETVPDHEYEQLKMALIYFKNYINQHMSDPNSDKSPQFLESWDDPRHPWARARHMAFYRDTEPYDHFSEDFKEANKSEPMKLAFQLLKNNRYHPEHEPMSSDDMIAYLDEEYLGHIGSKEVNPMEIYQDIMADTPESRKKQTNIMGRTYGGEPTFNMIPLAGEGQAMINPHAEIFRRSKPMKLAFQLLKERVSPEAKRRKLEYDKKYESSPERVKYREDLNRERRRRGIYGSHDHKDVSHTKGGKLTLEGEHENRARHFKEKGTLRDM